MSDSDGSEAGNTRAEHTQLTPLHHLFLHAVISRRNVTEAIAAKIHEKSCKILKVPYKASDYPDLITDLNDILNKLGFALKRSSDPVVGKPHLLFVNTRSDVLAQVATEFNPQEIMYFRILIEEIITADDLKFAITTFEATSASKEVKPPLKKTQAQTLLDSFVAKGWLHRSERGSYSLSLRSIVELEHYLTTEFDDETSVKCQRCDEIVTVGFLCPEEDCPVRMHKHCYRDFKKVKTACPGCSIVWPKDDKKMTPIGEEAIHADNTAFPPAQYSDTEDEPTQPAVKKGRKSATASKSNEKKAASAPSEEEEEDELQATQESPVQRKSTRSGRQSQASQKSKKAQNDPEEEDDDEEAMVRKIDADLTQMMDEDMDEL